MAREPFVERFYGLRPMLHSPKPRKPKRNNTAKQNNIISKDKSLKYFIILRSQPDLPNKTCNNVFTRVSMNAVSKSITESAVLDLVQISQTEQMHWYASAPSPYSLIGLDC